MFALDVDLLWIEKNPEQIVAVLDYKMAGDEITYAEAVAYNLFSKLGWWVLIIESKSHQDLEDGVFDLFWFQSADTYPNPPTVERQSLGNTSGWDDFNNWQQKIRDQAKRNVK